MSDSDDGFGFIAMEFDFFCFFFKVIFLGQSLKQMFLATWTTICFVTLRYVLGHLDHGVHVDEVEPLDLVRFYWMRALHLVKREVIFNRNIFCNI